MYTRTRVAVLLSAKLLLAGCIVAQTRSEPADPRTPSTQTAVEPPAPLSEGPPHTAPVLWISSVEILRSTHGPQLDVVRVRGLAATQGWQSAELVPLTHGVPADGILDLAMIAEAPDNNTAVTEYPAIEAIFAIEPGHPFKGVRVHGATNRVVLRTLPGYAASATPPRDCANCEGKTFVAKGQPTPAGIAAGVVREDELPRNLRILRETDGIGSIDSNPNRMTILLDEKDHIITALWD